jgi:hypothetical protein
MLVQMKYVSSVTCNAWRVMRASEVLLEVRSVSLDACLALCATAAGPQYALPRSREFGLR